jgi:hypothetical protein
VAKGKLNDIRNVFFPVGLRPGPAPAPPFIAFINYDVSLETLITLSVVRGGVRGGNLGLSRVRQAALARRPA